MKKEFIKWAGSEKVRYFYWGFLVGMLFVIISTIIMEVIALWLSQ